MTAEHRGAWYGFAAHDRGRSGIKMMKRIAYVLFCVGLVGCMHTRDLPDVTKSRPLGRWPDENDIALMHSVEGHGKTYVLKTLGHPKHVSQERRVEVWTYPWLAVMTVTFSNHVVVATYYDAGY